MVVDQYIVTVLAPFSPPSSPPPPSALHNDFMVISLEFSYDVTNKIIIVVLVFLVECAIAEIADGIIECSDPDVAVFAESCDVTCSAGLQTPSQTQPTCNAQGQLEPAEDCSGETIV